MPKLTEFREDVPKAALPKKVARWDEDHFPIYAANMSFWYYEDEDGIYSVMTYKIEDGEMEGVFMWVRSDRRGESTVIDIVREAMEYEDVSQFAAPIEEGLVDHYDQMGFDVSGTEISLEVS